MLGPKPNGLIKKVITSNASEKTFERQSFSKDSVGENVSTTSDVAVTAWLFRPQDSNVQTNFGERLDGDLSGLAHGSEDIQVNDRVTVGTTTYEVQAINNLPNDDNTSYKFFSLIRVHNTG